jgi:hypothetical protein
VFRGMITDKWIDHQREYTKQKKKETEEIINQLEHEIDDNDSECQSESSHQSISSNEEKEKKKNKKNKYENWGGKLAGFMIKQSHILWTDRCDQVHAANEKRESEQTKRRAAILVRAAYRHADHVSEEDKDLFFGVPLEERLKYTAKTLLEWHRTTNKGIKRAIADKEKSMAKGQLSLFGKLVKYTRQKYKQRTKPKAIVTKKKKKHERKTQTDITMYFTEPAHKETRPAPILRVNPSNTDHNNPT